VRSSLPTGLLSLASSRHEIGTGRVLKILVQHIIKEFRPSFVGWGGRMKRVPRFDQYIDVWKKKELITSEDSHPEITLLLFHHSLVMDSAKTKFVDQKVTLACFFYENNITLKVIIFI